MHDAADRREQALVWAHTARTTRQQVRTDLSSGRTSLDEVLGASDHDQFVGAVRLLWVLESLPGARKTDTRRALARLAIDGGLPLAQLTQVERATLRERFDVAAVTS